MGSGNEDYRQRRKQMQEYTVARKNVEMILEIDPEKERMMTMQAVADNLRTEKPMSRMIGYLLSAGPRSEEEIVDEMLAIMSDRDRWVQKKEAEYANQKYNEYLNRRREED